MSEDKNKKDSNAIESLKPIVLLPTIQNYHWGKQGKESLVAKLYNSATNSNIEETKPYAELWIGAHESSPATIKHKPESKVNSIIDYIKTNPELILGQKTTDEFNLTLPMLFKVLSINSNFGLSIQAHPDESLAKILHKKDPKNYPDSFPKPEMAIPLTTLTMLHGFKSKKELIEVFEEYSDLKFLLLTLTNTPKSNSEVIKEIGIKQLYSALLLANTNTSNSNLLSQTAEKIFQYASNKNIKSLADIFFLKLFKQYPANDPGLLSIYLMNIVQVQPGEAISIAPNVAHAYLDGELLECMKTSNNVVRGGLTTKFIDVETLIEMLDYSIELPTYVKPISFQTNNVSRYQPNFKEFLVDRISLMNESLELSTNNLVNLIFCLNTTDYCEISYQLEGQIHFLKISTGETCLIPSSFENFILKSNNAKLVRVMPNL